jgi:hypothetical protein
VLAYQERKAGDEAREREDRAAVEAKEHRRRQALSDLGQLMDNAFSFLNNAIPDLRMQELDPSSLPNDLHAQFGRRFILDDIVLEFHVWPDDAQEWRNALAELSKPEIPEVTDDPVVCAGRIVTDINLTGDRAWRYVNIRTLANLVAEVKAGRLRWYLYRYIYTADPQGEGYVAAHLFDRNRRAFDEGRPFGWMAMPFWITYLTRDTRFHAAVEPLSNESIANLVRELLHQPR